MIQWVSPIVTVVVMLVGLAANIFVMGRFIGRQTMQLGNIETSMARVETRVEDVEDLADSTESQRALMEGRLRQVETGVDRFWEMRDEFVRLRTTFEIESKHQAESLERLGRSVAVIERQLGNLVTSRAGFTTLSNEDAKGA